MDAVTEERVLGSRIQEPQVHLCELPARVEGALQPVPEKGGRGVALYKNVFWRLPLYAK